MQQLTLAYQKDPYRTRHVCHPYSPATHGPAFVLDPVCPHEE